MLKAGEYESGLNWSFCETCCPCVTGMLEVEWQGFYRQGLPYRQPTEVELLAMLTGLKNRRTVGSPLPHIGRSLLLELESEQLVYRFHP